MKKIIFVLFCSVYSINYAQEKPTINLIEILEQAVAGDKPVLTYSGYDIIIDQPTISSRYGKILNKNWIEDALKSNEKASFDEEGLLIIPSSIRLYECTFKNIDGFDRLNLSNIRFNKPLIIQSTDALPYFSLEFWNSKFDSYFIYRNEIDIQIEGCEFYAPVWIRTYHSDATIDIHESAFYSFPKFSFDITKADSLPVYDSFNSLIQVGDTLWPEALEISMKDGYLSITDNEFNLKEPLHRGVTVNGTIEKLEILDNSFNSWLKLACFVEKRLELSGNTFNSYIDLTECSLPELATNNKIHWPSIDSLRLSKIFDVPTQNTSYYWAMNGEFFHNFPFIVYQGAYYNSAVKDIHYDLIGVYRRLNIIFREQGNEEYANASYTNLKDIETTRFKGRYKEEGGFTNWVRWRLNQLLKQYTVYGTDPADAIVGSVYIIFFFGVFYFFFPSEWDSKSKKILLKDFKLFVQKNEHGYVKPFFNLISGFLLSLVNALTLSLNAFITLGFGNIPTQGLPRYVCVLQGLIGWFLLSIFTVSLINQILN